MEKRRYSAGMVKLSFWFSEFRKVVELLNAGKTWEEINVLNAEENIFGAPTATRSKQIVTTISLRVKGLDESFYRLFEESDVATQKVITLISIMQTDCLFFDFVYEVYRENLIVGNSHLADSDIRVFFKNKQIQSEKVASWQAYTLKRLGACYKTMLMEAGLISHGVGERELQKPILDIALERLLIDQGMERYVNALTGVR